jgi:hypothetical protein
MKPPPLTRVGGGAWKFSGVSKNSLYLKTLTTVGAPRRPVIVLSYVHLRKATRRLTPL